MKRLFASLTLLTCLHLVADGNPPTVTDQGLYNIQESAFGETPSAALKSFMGLMSSTRNATPQSSAAKAKAVRLFTEMYKDGTPEIQGLLAHMVRELDHVLKNRPFLLPGNKERLILMILQFSQDRLQGALKNQSVVTSNPGELSEAIYTALNPTFGDFWRKVFAVVGVGVGIGLMYYVYRKFRGPSTISKTMDLVTALNKPYDPSDKNTAVFLTYEIAETLRKERTQSGTNTVNKGPGLLKLLVEIFTHLKNTDDKLFREVAGMLPPILDPSGNQKK
ncbi:MAG: hypothetical protein QG632_28 [Candidatus Dependentiae bacterium]|nr:hypothetical protein [Candidatus Dependentiae bacterium]